MNLDWSSVIVAVISFLGTVAGSYGGFRLTAYRVAELEKKVDRHNSFAERIPIVETELKEIWKRINALEGRR